MAKVAAPGVLPSASLEIGVGALKSGSMRRRKTPSELRDEQLKRTSGENHIDESPSTLPGSINEVESGLKKPEFSRNPRYIDTRVDEVYPAKKSRFRMPPGKENAKDSNSVEQTSSRKNVTTLSSLVATGRQKLSYQENSVVCAEVDRDGSVQTSQTVEKGCHNTFRSVNEISSGADRSSSLASIDLGKALKGLAARETTAVFGLPDGFSQRSEIGSSYSGKFCSECHVPGKKAPLDFTLKTSMQVVSSSPVNWIHRSITCGALPQFCDNLGSQDHMINGHAGSTSNSQFSSSKLMHSWMYPQEILPSSLISFLNLSAVEGEVDFLRRRQIAWEDAFRSLYYILRNSSCNVFYVCTPHFVVMFTGDGSGGKKQPCHAYISQSTRGLRSLLTEHDVSFTMPLCNSKVEQVDSEDLVELSEIEKHNLGQMQRRTSFSDIDNCPESLLVFSGNKSVHSLYDFLLNYRSLLTSLTGADVPVLYSPVPFRNAALSSPEVRCMEIKRADHVASLKGCSMKNGVSTSPESGGASYRIEIKDTYIPPWIICSICSLLGSEGRSFEASFMTEPRSIGLNVALEKVCDQSEMPAAAGESSEQGCFAFGIPEAIVSPSVCSSSLKGLKYSNGSYTAFLSPHVALQP